MDNKLTSKKENHMDNLELPKKYTDYIKAFIKIGDSYELSINRNYKAKEYFFCSKSKKKCLEFLKENLEIQ